MTAGKSVNSAPGKSRKRSSLVRTNIVIDRDLVEEVKRRTGAKSAREAVQRALERAAAKPDYSALLALRDLDPIRPFYDPKDPMAEERAEQAMVREGKANYAVDTPDRKRTAKKRQ